MGACAVSLRDSRMASSYPERAITLPAPLRASPRSGTVTGSITKTGLASSASALPGRVTVVVGTSSDVNLASAGEYSAGDRRIWAAVGSGA